MKHYEFVEAFLDAGLLDLPEVTGRLELLPRERVLPGYLAKARFWVRSGPPTFEV